MFLGDEGMGFEIVATELTSAKGTNARLSGRLNEGAIAVGDKALVHFDAGPVAVHIRGIMMSHKSVPSAEAPALVVMVTDQAEELFATWDWADPTGMTARITEEESASPIPLHKLRSSCPNCGSEQFYKADNGSHRSQPVIEWYCCAGCGRVESFAADPVWFKSMGETISIKGS